MITATNIKIIFATTKITFPTKITGSCYLETFKNRSLLDGEIFLYASSVKTIEALDLTVIGL